MLHVGYDWGRNKNLYQRVPLVYPVWSSLCLGGGSCDAQSHPSYDRFVH